MSGPTDFALPAPMPTSLPVMALLRGVLLPGSFSPFHVGRASSIAALEASKNDLILIAPQLTPEREPAASDLFATATLGRIVKRQRRNGGLFIVVQGLARVEVDTYRGPDPYFRATFTVIPQEWPSTPAAHALEAAIRDTIKDTGDVMGEQQRVQALLTQLNAMPLIVDGVAAAIDEQGDFKRDMLNTLDPMVRAEKVLEALLAAREVVKAKKDLGDRIKNEQQDRQREHFLRQQLDAIQKELGDGDDDIVAQLTATLAEIELPERVRDAVDRELRRLARMGSASPERNSAVDWLERISTLPWSTYTAGDLDFDLLEQTLDESHYGLDDVKRQVIEYLSVRKLQGKGRADVLLLVGPPGVGKTSIGQAIAGATGRELIRVALGGVRDEAELRGHRRTYVGSRPGRIIEGFRRAGTADPVILLDEVDKISRGVLGDPAAALLEILDPEQNHEFVDHYLEVPFDLSRALFVATANDLGGIPSALRDRMEIIQIAGYTPTEKATIARRYLLRKAAENAGLETDDVQLDDATLEAVIHGWTREAGVRQLQRTLGRLYRAAAVHKARGTLDAPLEIGVEDLPTYLKRRRFEEPEHEPFDRPGIATGLAWTPVGGDILYVEASTLPGAGRLVLTGQLGDVMKESARAALTYVLNRDGAESPSDTDIHIHVPSGSIPKDGPSAGVTMFTALSSLLSGRNVRSDTAMTGEATLRGRVLPVGGIKSKVLAAHQRGIRRIILPKKNAGDLDDVPTDVRESMEFFLVDHMDEALEFALEPESDAEPTADLTEPAPEGPALSV